MSCSDPTSPFLFRYTLWIPKSGMPYSLRYLVVFMGHSVVSERSVDCPLLNPYLKELFWIVFIHSLFAYTYPPMHSFPQMLGSSSSKNFICLSGNHNCFVDVWPLDIVNYLYKYTTPYSHWIVFLSSYICSLLKICKSIKFSLQTFIFNMIIIVIHFSLWFWFR